MGEKGIDKKGWRKRKESREERDFSHQQGSICDVFCMLASGIQSDTDAQVPSIANGTDIQTLKLVKT